MATPTDHWCFKLVRAQQIAQVNWVFQLQQSLSVDDGRLEQNCGCQLPNPVGLAAGFDKDGAAGFWSSLGWLCRTRYGDIPRATNPRPAPARCR